MSEACFPELRFVEFEGTWTDTKLGALMEFRNGMNADKSRYGQGYKFVNVLDVIAEAPILDKNIIGRVDADTDEVSRFSLENGDIVFQRSSETREDAGQANAYIGKGEALFGGFVIRGRPTTSLDAEYMAALLRTDNARKNITNLAGGSTRFNVGQETLSSVQVHLAPTLLEQEKIARFLSAVDAKLASVEAQLTGWRDYKRGMIQAIFSQSLRFKANDGSNFLDWQTVKFSEVLLEHKLKSAGTEPVYSVSVHKGLVNQIEHLGRSYSAADTGHYNSVKRGDIIYTKSPTGNFPLGIIKQSKIDKDVIVSPLYGVFTPSTFALGTILNAYFEAPEPVWNYLNPIVQKGAKNTISCTNANFLSNKLKLPTDEAEQQKIADALSAIDTKIEALTQRLQATREFKRGLLQKMFV